MSQEYITLGNNKNPPRVNIEMARIVYDCIRTEEFDVELFNSLLSVVVVYLDKHEIEFCDKNLPWAESKGLIQ